MSVEIAKELLRKGIALQDEELIAMANSLLNETALANYNVTTYKEQKEQQKKPVKKLTKKPTAKKLEAIDKTEPMDFTMRSAEQESTKKVPVNKVKRGKNLFTDDKTEFMDNETPKVKLTPRNRPKAKAVYKNCESCGNRMKVVSGDGYTSSYICDDCIMNKKRKGRSE